MALDLVTPARAIAFGAVLGVASVLILGLGAIIMMLVFWVEFRFEPPWWLHVLIWLPLTLGLCLALLRPAKGLMVALQYRHKAEEGRFEP